MVFESINTVENNLCIHNWKETAFQSVTVHVFFYMYIAAPLMLILSDVKITLEKENTKNDFQNKSVFCYLLFGWVKKKTLM